MNLFDYNKVTFLMDELSSNHLDSLSYIYGQKKDIDHLIRIKDNQSNDAMIYLEGVLDVLIDPKITDYDNIYAYYFNKFFNMYYRPIQNWVEDVLNSYEY